MIATEPRSAYECSFCTASIDVLTCPTADLLDWTVVYTGSDEPTVFCPRCHAAYEPLVAAIAAAVDQIIARRTA